MKLELLLVTFILLLTSGCDFKWHTSSGKSNGTISITTNGSSQELTMKGVGVALLAGDKVELKESTVFVNDVSYGPVPADAIVQYSVNSNGKVLRVAGERRSKL
jgi:hypothetical protein